MFYCIRILGLVFLPISIYSFEDVKLQEQMFKNLDVLSQSFDVKYAPATMKKKCFDWILSNEIFKTKTLITEKSVCTTKDFQISLRKLFTTAHDYHTRIEFFSTEGAELPFRLQKAEGKYFITWIYPHLENINKKLFKDSLEIFNEAKLQLGDEVLIFDGLPVEEQIQDIKRQYFDNGKSETDQRLAEAMLTCREGKAGVDVPQGLISITIKRDNEVLNRFLKWFYQPEEISSRISYLSPRATKHSILHKRRLSPYYEEIHRSICKDEDFLGSLEGFLPKLGEVSWEWTGENFVAYIFESKKKYSVGYIRIPDYESGDSKVEDFRTIISYFCKNTDGLVIDQMNNAGGYSFYLYALLSYLIDKPLIAPKESCQITQEEVAEAVDLHSFIKDFSTKSECIEEFGNTFDGYPVDLELINCFKKQCLFILDEWNKGRILTSPNYLSGLEKIYPNSRVRYSKPLLVLVNELDFSCADLLPAILQDNKRAKVMGSKTAGAGGYVASYSYPNRMGIERYFLTGSIAQRMDDTYLENTGVYPDYPYEITANDLQFGYKNFAKEINSTIDELLYYEINKHLRIKGVD